MNWLQLFVVAFACAGFGWWLVNGDQRFLVRAQDWWLSWFPAGRVQVTWVRRERNAHRYAADGSVAVPHCLGKVATCQVCCTFWVAVIVAVVAALVCRDAGWLLLPFVTVPISNI